MNAIRVREKLLASRQAVRYILYGTHYVRHMPIDSDIVEKLKLELRRGTLILAVLSALRSEHYGYSLRVVLAEQGVEIDEGALYPMLRRLETQGLLTSQWREEGKRQKRFYKLSDDGAQALETLVGEWRAMNAALGTILKEDGA